MPRMTFGPRHKKNLIKKEHINYRKPRSPVASATSVVKRGHKPKLGTSLPPIRDLSETDHKTSL
jgi:hypothetical protein